MRNHQLTTIAIEQLLADKLQGAARSDLVKYKRAYEVMGRPKGGVTYEIFHEKVLGMGIPAREEQLHELFDKYDTLNKGLIEFNELVRQILPKDYPSKTWTTLRGEEMAAEEYQRLVEGKQNASKQKFKPNMTLVQSRGNTPRRMDTGRSSSSGSRSGRRSGSRDSPSSRKVPVTARGGGSRDSPSGGGGGGGGSRPVSRALAARLNSVERMNTARKSSKK